MFSFNSYICHVLYLSGSAGAQLVIQRMELRSKRKGDHYVRLFSFGLSYAPISQKYKSAHP
tara:strand:- start:1550 stop:1732 length:183 start_codon:yes stop_codon:yes gene_type:complete